MNIYLEIARCSSCGKDFPCPKERWDITECQGCRAARTLGAIQAPKSMVASVGEISPQEEAFAQADVRPAELVGAIVDFFGRTKFPESNKWLTEIKSNA